MTSQELVDLFDRIVAECREEMVRKNADYADDNNDALANFYDGAKECEVTPLKAWAIHARKHDLAVRRVVRGRKLESETLSGRLKDRIVYTVLLAALVQEETK